MDNNNKVKTKSVFIGKLQSTIKKKKRVIISTTESIPKRKVIEVLGIARGSTVRSRNFARDWMAGIKTMVGGEIEEYTKLQADAREQAILRMVRDASDLGADAVLCVRLESNAVSQGCSEVVAYGTAVITQ